MRFSLLSQLITEPWFIAESVHAELLSEMLHASAAVPSGPTEADITRTLALAFTQRTPARMEKDTGIAHIHVFGPVARNLPPLERAMGKTDFAQIHEDFAAARSAGANGILLHIDSPGGTVNGTAEAADLVSQLRNQTPVYVHAQRAGSAAYYIAAGAERVFADPSADVGSIGVMFPRVNLSGVMEKLGVKSETITNTAGDLKNISPTAELTPVQKAHLQEQADAMFADFRAHVLNNRAVPDSAMRGQTFTGRAAVAAGLIDSIGSAADARAALLNRISATAAR